MCSACSNGYLPVDGLCACPQPKKVNSSGSCVECNVNFCSICSLPNVCAACVGGRYIENGQCSCPPDTRPTPLLGECVGQDAQGGQGDGEGQGGGASVPIILSVAVNLILAVLLVVAIVVIVRMKKGARRGERVGDSMRASRAWERRQAGRSSEVLKEASSEA